MIKFKFKLTQDLNDPLERDDEFQKAVDNFVKSRNMYYAKITLAALYAEVLATEGYLCVKSKLGFAKYLN